MIKQLLKIFSASVLAFVILNIVCYFYYNPPVHYTNPSGFTDYTWEKNTFYSRATEGFACGKTNNEGLIDSHDYRNQKTDVLLIGSSQFEGFSVSQKNNISNLLGDKLGEDYFVYNIGVSGHDFLRCVQNYNAAYEKYKPKKCVIFEVPDLNLKNADIEAALSGSIDELRSSENKLVITFEKIPLLRHCYNQLDNALHSSSEGSAEEIKEENISDNLDALMKKLVSESNGTKIIILYHSAVNQSDLASVWETACKNNGVSFVNMSESFEKAKSENKYVYGFINTLPDNGHLNSYGNQLIAEKLYEEITRRD